MGAHASRSTNCFLQIPVTVDFIHALAILLLKRDFGGKAHLTPMALGNIWSTVADARSLSAYQTSL